MPSNCYTGFDRYVAECFGNDRTDSAWQKSGATCNEWSRVPGGNLRRSEIFQPTATSKRFVVGLPQRNASCFHRCWYAKRLFPTSSGIVRALCICTYNVRYPWTRGVAHGGIVPTPDPKPCHLSVVIYLDRADEWCSLDTRSETARRTESFTPQPPQGKYTCRRWGLIAFMQH